MTTSFSLRTTNDTQMKKAESIIKGLQETFGLENVEVTKNVKNWTSVDIENTYAMVFVFIANQLHIAKLGKERKTFDISLDDVDTIYKLR